MTITNTEAYVGAHGTEPRGKWDWTLELIFTGGNGRYSSETLTGMGTLAQARSQGWRQVVAKLWKNSHKNGGWYNVTISRIYTDDEDEFHDSDSFSRDDLLHAADSGTKTASVRSSP